MFCAICLLEKFDTQSAEVVVYGLSLCTVHVLSVVESVQDGYIVDQIVKEAVLSRS